NVRVPLNKAFQIDLKKLKATYNSRSKLLFLCSPNNPTGNLLKSEEMLEVIRSFPGMVVVDEAYIDFSTKASWLGQLDEFPNLIVLQTLSKAWGMAGIRVGVAMGNPYVISMLERIKPPYNLSLANQELALQALQHESTKNDQVNTLLAERKKLFSALIRLALVREIVESDANFLLVRFYKAQTLFEYLIERGVIVRNRTKELHCEDCLRITIGTPDENERLVKLIQAFKA
ncbi:MAG: aminotransferase class I/II-fold pyridoxal phosphate-dependent enzyme, partial [Marinoscillum sp.]